MNLPRALTVFCFSSFKPVLCHQKISNCHKIYKNSNQICHTFLFISPQNFSRSFKFFSSDFFIHNILNKPFTTVTVHLNSIFNYEELLCIVFKSRVFCCDFSLITRFSAPLTFPTNSIDLNDYLPNHSSFLNIIAKNVFSSQSLYLKPVQDCPMNHFSSCALHFRNMIIPDYFLCISQIPILSLTSFPFSSFFSKNFPFLVDQDNPLSVSFLSPIYVFC